MMTTSSSLHHRAQHLRLRRARTRLPLPRVAITTNALARRGPNTGLWRRRLLSRPLLRIRRHSRRRPSFAAAVTTASSTPRTTAATRRAATRLTLTARAPTRRRRRPRSLTRRSRIPRTTSSRRRPLRPRSHPIRIIIPRQLPRHALNHRILILVRVTVQLRETPQHDIDTPRGPRLREAIPNIQQRRLARLGVGDFGLEPAVCAGGGGPGGAGGGAAHGRQGGREERGGVGVRVAAPGVAVGRVAGGVGLVPGADAGLAA